MIRSVLPRDLSRWLRYEVRRLLFDRPTPLGARGRKELLPLFLDDIGRLERLIDRDLSHWTEVDRRDR